MLNLEIFKQIDTFIFDVDGVMTNNEILVTENGEFLRTMNIRDGFAMKRALLKGYKIFVITAGKSEGVAKRLKQLGINEIYSNIQNKIDIYQKILSEHNLKESQILYMGDDLPDYEIMSKVGLACCPSDAVPEIISISTYVSPLAGGKNCVRDVIEKVLKLRGHWID
jgi:3-deoxy-D-manno-octulosonate 8-phosphate phosphatase (KDO 8-P phosphatase)